MLSKSRVLEILNLMPDQFSLEDLIERLILLDKIEIGLKQAEEGETYITEQAKRMVKEWSK